MSFQLDLDFVRAEVMSKSPGFPVVLYQGYSISLDRSVVYKVIENTRANAGYVARIRKEAEVMMQLKSQNICEVFAWKGLPQGQKTDYWCVVMEKLDKDWGKEISRKATAYEETLLWERLYVLLSTLAALQSRSIAHRDIKPHNIFLTTDQPPRVKLADFDSCKSDFAMSSPATLQGTVPYLSPKLYKAYRSKTYKLAHNVYKSDLYSLGMTLLHAAELRMPEEGLSGLQLSQQLQSLQYSSRFKEALTVMLREDEETRPDLLEFAQLMAVIPTFDRPYPYIDRHPRCLACDNSCAHVPFIELPCSHLLACCSRTCLTQFAQSAQRSGCVACRECTKRYQYTGFAAFLPRMEELYT